MAVRRRTIATWHLTPRGNVRVTLTTWWDHRVIDQEGATVAGLRDAWHVVVGSGACHPSKASDKSAFRAWAALGKRG